jgi:hypothetical protein
MEDHWGMHHPDGVCHQHVLCDCVRDQPGQRLAIRAGSHRLHSLPLLRLLPGRWTLVLMDANMET